MTASTIRRPVTYQLALNTTTGRRQFTGAADLYGRITDQQAEAAIAQHHTAGTSTPVAEITITPAA